MINTKTRPVFWGIIGDKWAVDKAQEKINEAVDWFSNNYCITIDQQPISDLQDNTKKIAKQLIESGEGYTNSIRKTFKRIWKKSIKKRAFLILFVDAIPASGVQYLGDAADIDKRARFKIAGNFVDLPLILVPYDTDHNSLNIVTHELIHAFGKKFKSKSKKTTVNPEKAPEKDPAYWTHSSCDNDMGSTKRENSQGVFNNNNNLLLDYASYAYFVWTGNIA